MEIQIYIFLPDETEIMNAVIDEILREAGLEKEG